MFVSFQFPGFLPFQFPSPKRKETRAGWINNNEYIKNFYTSLLLGNENEEEVDETCSTHTREKKCTHTFSRKR